MKSYKQAFGICGKNIMNFEIRNFKIIVFESRRKINILFSNLSSRIRRV